MMANHYVVQMITHPHERMSIACACGKTWFAIGVRNANSAWMDHIRP